LFNALAGYKAVTSNYPGTTVEAMEARTSLDGEKVRLVDTPGIYSMSDATIEERVTKRILLETEPDVIINILDTTGLEKALYFTLQLLEASLPVVATLNFVEEARKRGIDVSADQLAALLGIPVFSINPLRKTGIGQLAHAALTAPTGHGFTVTYDDHIEQAIKMVEGALPDDLPFSKRFVALRVLEGDEYLAGHLHNQRILEQVATQIPEHPNLQEDIAVNRHGVAAYIARLVTAFTKREKPSGWRESEPLVLGRACAELLILTHSRLHPSVDSPCVHGDAGLRGDDDRKRCGGNIGWDCHRHSLRLSVLLVLGLARGSWRITAIHPHARSHAPSP
jgi:ferrous iron transport protein B